MLWELLCKWWERDSNGDNNLVTYGNDLVSVETSQ